MSTIGLNETALQAARAACLAIYDGVGISEAEARDLLRAWKSGDEQASTTITTTLMARVAVEAYLAAAAQPGASEAMVIGQVAERLESQRDRAIAAGEELLAQRDAALARADRAESEAARLRTRLDTPTPEMIAAAWAAFRGDRMGRLGPGPGFVEAIQAAGRMALADIDNNGTPQGRDCGPAIVRRPAGAADAAGVEQPREADNG